MITFDPNAIYSRQDLLEMFKPLGIDWDVYRQRLNLQKISRFAWLGSDLIEAIANAPRMGAKKERTAPAALPVQRKKRGGKLGIPSLLEIAEAEMARK